MNTIADLLREARRYLADSSAGNENNESHALDAELLLSHALGKSRTYLYTWPEQEVGDTALSQFQHWLSRRQQGEPVAYLLGRREFYGHEFLVSPDTLIPRPDTELLVDIALEKLDAQAPLRLVDLGAGTGAIAISLGLARPHWQLLAADYTVAVVDLLERNIRRLKAANVTPLQSDWYRALSGRFDAIISNPPYIPAGDVHLSRGDVRYEPRSALVAGDDGLDDIRLIIDGAGARLNSGGLLLLEHGYDQAKAVSALMQQAGFLRVETRTDLGGNERATLGFYKSDAQKPDSQKLDSQKLDSQEPGRYGEPHAQ